MITEHHALFLLPVSVVLTQRVTLRPSSGNNQTDRWGQHCCRLSFPNRKLYCLSATWWILCVCVRTPNRKSYCLSATCWILCVCERTPNRKSYCVSATWWKLCVCEDTKSEVVLPVCHVVDTLCVCEDNVYSPGLRTVCSSPFPDTVRQPSNIFLINMIQEKDPNLSKQISKYNRGCMFLI